MLAGKVTCRNEKPCNFPHLFVMWVMTQDVKHVKLDDLEIIKQDNLVAYLDRSALHEYMCLNAFILLDG